MSTTDPTRYKGKKVPAFPYDQSNKSSSVLVLPIIVAGEIVGYLPAKAIDNGDGTATLKVDTELTLAADNVTVGNIKVASTDQSTANEKFIKVKPDGTVFVTPDLLAVFDTNVKQWGGTIQSGADLTPLFQHLNTDLSTRASEATLATRATEATLALVKSDLDEIALDTDNLNTPLSTRASELTLSGIKTQTDKLTFDATSSLLVQEEQKSTGTAVAVPVTNTIGPATLILAANANRQEYTVVHEDPSAVVYLGFANTVTTLTGIPIVGNQMYGSNKYTGAIYAVASVAGPISVRVAEVA